VLAVVVGFVFGSVAFTRGSWFDKILFFAITFSYFASLTFVAHPRALQTRDAHAAAKSAIGSQAGREPKQSLKLATDAITKPTTTVEPTVAPVVLAMSDVWRKRPLFDQAAFYVPCFWIGFTLVRTTYRWADGRFRAGAISLIWLVIPLLSLLGRGLTNKRRSNATFVYAALSKSGQADLGVDDA
jgi:hypothetical protein